jgi:hypothetical protein
VWEVTGLTTIGNEYACLGWRYIIGDVRTEFMPHKIKWVCRPNLWRVGTITMEFVGGLTCHLIPNSSLWRLDVSVECFCHTDKVSASTIDNVGSKELYQDLDDTTVLSPMFEVERAVDHLVCPNVVMSKGFSTGDGKGFISHGCRGHI